PPPPPRPPAPPAPPPPPTAARNEVVFEVWLDEVLVLRHPQAIGDGASCAWHRRALPPEPRADARLRFRLAGPPVNAAFLLPAIGPAEDGPAAPSSEKFHPPSIVLFLADTFRADNLSLYGGDPATAPFLNDLAGRSARFRRAWSPSAWTLPAQATMLTGLYPGQHGATRRGLGLPAEATTIAELLGRHGYRTAAVTDSGFISRSFGFDQGFQFFHERRDWDLRATLAEAKELLQAAEGRPTFLFVQTYRTHTPYRIGEDEDRAPVRALLADVRTHCTEWGGDGTLSVLEAATRLERIYREGARALDAGLGAWFRDLQADGTLANAVFLFTSDHGEEFWEHGEVGHGGTHWEERIRIPLLAHGPGLAPRDIWSAATLADLPRTIAGLAGFPVPGNWEGRDLLAELEDRSVLSFEYQAQQERVTILRDGHKVFGPADEAALRAGTFHVAFDLATDPAEVRPILAPGEAPWPAELCRGEAARIGRLLRPVAASPAVELGVEQEQHLRDIGYGP
ncbi:MAG: sulfatase, partial [Planctomycetota bacterium]